MNTPTFIIGTPTLAVATAAMADGIDAATHIPIGAALSVAAVVLPACWYLATKFRSIDSQLEKLGEHLKGLPCAGRGCNRKHAEE